MFGLFKSSAQKNREEIEAHFRKINGDAYRDDGLEGLITKRQRKVDEYEDRMRSFFDDITAYFRKSNLEAFLKGDYNMRTKHEGMSEGTRHLGMKWYTDSDGLRHEFAFVFLEEDDKVRLDFVANIYPLGYVDSERMQKEINMDYDASQDNIYKMTPKYRDALRSVRRYDSYAEWANTTDGMPVWFMQVMKDGARRLVP